MTTTNNSVGILSDDAMRQVSGNRENPSAARDLVTRLGLLIDRFQLDSDFRIGANDLLAAYRATQAAELMDLDEFAESVEHLAFYLRSVDGKGLNAPKAWAIKQLKAGYYPRPVGFESWEEQQQRIKTEARVQKALGLKTLRKKQFDADFDIWMEELPLDERKKLVPHECEPTGPAARALLRSVFAKQVGKEEMID